jgi:hypothetical protein
MVNYMHVSSNGDLVEITGERDSLAISCDLFTHAMNMLMSMYKRGNCIHSIHCKNSYCRVCAEEVGCLDTRIGTCIF